ncbi:MAG: BsuPI-related putative proteinase inhibitor [Chthoniobacteraceae bacterium]
MNGIPQSAGMKKLCILACVAALASLRAADEAPAKPGFWKRAFGKTMDGVGSVWDATKSVGKKTADVVAAPFGKKGGKEGGEGTAWRNLAMSVKLEPAKVRLADTRVIEVTVSVVNKGKQAVQLEFPSSLRIEVIVKVEGGRIISRWSDDERIDKEPGILLINPGERLEYSAKISTREMTAGKPFEIEAYFPSYEKLRASRTVVPEP